MAAVALPAQAHFVQDTPYRVFEVSRFVAVIDSPRQLTATHNQTLQLVVTTGGVMASHPDAQTPFPWAAELGAMHLNGSFRSTVDGRWQTTVLFPVPGNWTFVIQYGNAPSGPTGSTTLQVHPHLGYGIIIEGPLRHPTSDSPFDIVFRFEPEREHPSSSLPADARVRIEARSGMDGYISTVAETDARLDANGTWRASLALPNGTGYHLLIASAEGGFSWDGFAPFGFAMSPATVPPESNLPKSGIALAALAMLAGIVLWNRRRAP